MSLNLRTKEGDGCALLFKLLYAILAKVTLAGINHLGHAFGRNPLTHGKECAALWRTTSALLSGANLGAKGYKLFSSGVH
jgi:hypothetical protein